MVLLLMFKCCLSGYMGLKNLYVIVLLVLLKLVVNGIVGKDGDNVLILMLNFIV